VRVELEEEIEKLSSLARERGAEPRRIAAHEIVVAEWVRFKCRYGCKGYGKHMSSAICSRTRRDAADDR